MNLDSEYTEIEETSEGLVISVVLCEGVKVFKGWKGGASIYLSLKARLVFEIIPLSTAKGE